MNSIFSNISFVKPTNYSNLIVRGSLGAAIGGALRGAITLLSRGKFAPLAYLGWGVVGCIIAIATKIFQKKAAVAPAHLQHQLEAPHEKRELPRLVQAEVVINKTLLDASLEKWDAYINQVSATELENELTELRLPVKEGDRFLAVWNPKAFILLVSHFANQRQPTLTSPTEAFEFARDNIEDVANLLIDIKMKKTQLPAFEQQAARLLEAYIPVRATDGSYIRGKHSKEQFETHLKTYLTFVESALQ